MTGRNLAAFVIMGWIAAGLQQGLSSSINWFGSRPDFLLIAIAAASPFLTRKSGAVYGFVLGLTHGALVGANLMYLALTRTLAGFVGGWINDLRFAPSFLVMFLTAGGLTLLAGLVQLFLSPSPGIADYLGATILSAVYNGVLVWPVYALYRRFLDPVYR